MANQTLIEALGIEHLLPEEQEAMLLDLNELVFKGTLVRMLEVMTPEAKEKFETLLASDAPEEELQAFLEANVPGTQQMVLDTVEELKNDILSVTGGSQD
jgi:hypothetical protein